MIASVLRLTKWELFKARRRWMPWILLGIVVIVVQFSLWSAYISYETTDLSVVEISGSYERGQESIEYSWSFNCRAFETGQIPSPQEGVDEEAFNKQIERHRDVCENLDEEEKAFRELSRQSFILPNSLSNSQGIAATIGAFLIMILASTALGVEYGWGTLRGALTRGTGRWQFLASKVIALVLMIAAGLLVLSLTVVISSLFAALLTLHEGGGLADSGEWSTALVMLGKGIYGLTSYVLLALFFTVLTSSAGIGIAISLAYYLSEAVTVAILVNLFDWFDNLTDFLLGTNLAAWMFETGMETTGANALLLNISELPGMLHAFVVLLAYMVVLGGVSFWLFQRRDIAGARGE